MLQKGENERILWYIQFLCDTNSCSEFPNVHPFHVGGSGITWGFGNQTEKVLQQQHSLYFPSQKQLEKTAILACIWFWNLGSDFMQRNMNKTKTFVKPLFSILHIKRVLFILQSLMSVDWVPLQFSACTKLYIHAQWCSRKRRSLPRKQKVKRGFPFFLLAQILASPPEK